MYLSLSLSLSLSIAILVDLDEALPLEESEAQRLEVVRAGVRARAMVGLR